MFNIAGTLGISNTVATSIVSIILTGSTMITIILAITALLSSGADAILTIGWDTLVTTVKEIAAKKGTAAAVAW